MTEQEWLACEDPLKLLAYLDADLEDPKVFRVTADSFLRHWQALPPVGQHFAQLAQDAAAGKAKRQDLDNAFDELEEAFNDLEPPGMFTALLDLAYGMWQSDAWDPEIWDSGEAESCFEERRAQANMVRQIFGNPFRKDVGEG